MFCPKQYRSFWGQPFQAECTQTKHNNGTVSLTFTETKNTKCRKKQAEPKIVRTPLYACICN